MRIPSPQAVLLLIMGGFSIPTAFAECAVSWDQLINTEAEHRDCFRNFGGDQSHFTTTWQSTGGWNETEGFMRWTVSRALSQDDDGYWINHPETRTRPIFLSFVARVGSTWWASHGSSDRFKFVMFYPATSVNPRPTIFNMPISSSAGAYSYRTFGPDLEAGGQGCDEFGNCSHNQSSAFPNHRYKEDAAGHDRWYFIVMSLESDRTKTYIWNQDGTISGLYAQSLPASSTTLSSWNAQTWRTVRLLAYILTTTPRDANSYMDIGHIRVSQSLPSPPAGFVTGEAPAPRPPTDVVVD